MALAHLYHLYQDCLFKTAPQLLPVLKGSIDDSDANTRHLTCLAMHHLFAALPGALSGAFCCVLHLSPPPGKMPACLPSCLPAHHRSPPRTLPHPTTRLNPRQKQQRSPCASCTPSC